ncbi:hypothetical protein [Enterococcus phage PEF9]
MLSCQASDCLLLNNIVWTIRFKKDLNSFCEVF